MESSLQSLARRALAALDLTSLGEEDTLVHIESLCASAYTPFGAPAALCVYPEWVATCRAQLIDRNLLRVRVATVVNFPDGSDDSERVRRETCRALAAGADEIDVVFPYRSLIGGDAASAAAVLRACRECCGDSVRMKVILETGELRIASVIRTAAEIALDADADFLKTSTGKVPVNATPQAARVMLEAIRDRGADCGFKAAGGVRTLDDAATYFAIADELLGTAWATPDRFRFGASALLRDISRVLSGDASVDGLEY